MPSNSLEQEAMERVRRMYSGYDRRPSSSDMPRPQPKPEPPRKPSEPEPPVTAHREKNSGLLDMLMQDKEQSLIMLLLVLMMKDGADMELLLALMYLLI